MSILFTCLISLTVLELGVTGASLNNLVRKEQGEVFQSAQISLNLQCDSVSQDDFDLYKADTQGTLDAQQSALDGVQTEQGNLQGQVQGLSDRVTELQSSQTSSSTLQRFVCATQEYWVTEVVDFSSEYGGSWAASTLIGYPDVYPQYGDIAGAWTPNPLTSSDYITVSYSQSVYIRQIEIYETLHSGAVTLVELKKPDGSWYAVYTAIAEVLSTSRVLQVPVFGISFVTDTVKVTLDCTVANSWVELDAIMVKGVASTHC